MTRANHVVAQRLLGITKVFPGQVQDSTHVGVAMATWAVPLEYKQGAASLWAEHSKTV
jgi:hypothetical protein